MAGFVVPDEFGYHGTEAVGCLFCGHDTRTRFRDLIFCDHVNAADALAVDLGRELPGHAQRQWRAKLWLVGTLVAQVNGA
jgi:hypothetical protein